MIHIGKFSSPEDIQIYISPRDQQRAEEFFRRTPEAMLLAYRRASQRYAKIILDIVKRAIATGLPPPGSGVSWPPLSPKTLKTYASWKYPNAHPWYLVGAMYRRVGIFQTRKRDYQVRVGFPHGVRAAHPAKSERAAWSSRPTLTALARQLEEGSNKVPSRPLFRPAVKAAGGTRRLNTYLVEELRKEFRKLTRKLKT